jgi:DNA-binding transcriptional LysR family regulator
MFDFDLRLLSVFDEIYKTRSVSRAADVLNLGQPAVSIALSRLREHFNDPLFVRTANGMEPTSLGQELIHPMREALTALGRALGHRSVFEPKTARRTFCICMNDISQLVLLPRLWAEIRAVAANIEIDIAPLSLETPRQLESGAADLALGFLPQLDAGFYQQKMFGQHYVCMVAADHPRIPKSLTLRLFQSEAHAVIIGAGTGHAILEKELVRQGIERRIALRIPSYVGVAFVVEGTDLVVTIPQRLADVLKGHGNFRIFPPPMPLPSYSIKQHWHERFHQDPGNQWLRSVISKVLQKSSDIISPEILA